MIHDSVATSRCFIAQPSGTRRQAWERAYTDKVELSQSQESHNYRASYGRSRKAMFQVAAWNPGKNP